LLRLIRIENPHLVFLMETRLKEGEMDRIRVRCGFNSGLFVSCAGLGKERSGGIALLWNEQLDFSILSYSLNHILGRVDDFDSGRTWFVSGIYGHPEECNKKKTWDLIRKIAADVNDMWICFGDINDVLAETEKSGGNRRSFEQLQLGRSAMLDSGLFDLGFYGYPFTWSNGRDGPNHIQCRLDRAMATDNFINNFSPVHVTHLPRYGSDHAAILMELEVAPDSNHKKKPHLFRFEKCWTLDARCEDLIKNAWRRGNQNFTSRLEAIQSIDSEFKEYRTNGIKKEILNIESLLKSDSMWSEDLESISAYKELERKHAELLKVEETMWRQRSRAIWLKEGDKNTSFFHGKAKQRGKVNVIKKLKDESGIWWHGDDKVERVLLNFFSELFASSNPVDTDQVCSVVHGRLNADHKKWCDEKFSTAEVKEALDQMHPLKAPGPDGLPALFFQKYWHIVGEEVQSLVLRILNEGESPESINKTYIALIPKCKNPVSPKHFRPISLCNVVLKLVTKVIANRLKPILPEIIDEEQSAFVQGRLITDNALIAMECFHWMKKKTKGKKGLMALKLDMAKAFDRIEWPFVQAMLSTMGFPETLIKTIMNCITSVSYQILINGQPSKCFSPERGLRQGDPLSPYLFILCANVLSGLLKKESQQSNIHGIQIARNAPKITHLLFADDSLLFARANPKEAETIMKVLQSYQLASGQMVNLDKSEVSFSRNVPEIEKDMICHQIAIKTVASHSRYLGLPVIFGRSKKDVFSFVQERIWKKVKGWKEKFLSRAGKETLIKSVAQAIPNYIMSCYKIPEGCCKSIESMLAKFWWGSEETSRKVHWLSWQRLGTAKERGGLGFRSFHDFNKALLGKQCWRLITDPNSLAARIFKCRYHPRKEFMAAKVGFQPSYAWRSLMHAKEVISSGARWAIGNGQKVQIYNDG
jgi:hypothetical protein